MAERIERIETHEGSKAEPHPKLHSVGVSGETSFKSILPKLTIFWFMGRREPWPLGQQGDTIPSTLGGSPGYPPFSFNPGVPNTGVSGPVCSGPTGHIVLLPCLEDSGSQSSCPRPTPWPLASRPRLQSPRVIGGRVGAPHRGEQKGRACQSQSRGKVSTS